MCDLDKENYVVPSTRMTDTSDAIPICEMNGRRIRWKSPAG